MGGAGIFPSAGLPKDTCELVKMYLIPDARHIGLGRKLISICLEKAKETGYKKVYLETLPELKQAVKVYEKFGFTYLKGPLGNTGHFGCNVWMIHELTLINLNRSFFPFIAKEYSGIRSFKIEMLS